jgi:hypothetical protein
MVVTVIYTSLYAVTPVMSHFSHFFKYAFLIYVLLLVQLAAPTSVYLILDMGDWKEVCVFNSL